jgi:hypothetical protein
VKDIYQMGDAARENLWNHRPESRSKSQMEGNDMKTWKSHALLVMLGCSIAALTASQLCAQCADMSNSVSGSAKVNGNEVIGSMSNNSGQDLYVWYTFKKNGVPSTSMANAGAGVLKAGQTNSEGGGIYSYEADTNPARFYWYAVPLSQKNANNCQHSW